MAPGRDEIALKTHPKPKEGSKSLGPGQRGLWQYNPAPTRSVLHPPRWVPLSTRLQGAFREPSPPPTRYRVVYPRRILFAKFSLVGGGRCEQLEIESPGSAREATPHPTAHPGPSVPLAGNQRLPFVQHPHALVEPVVGDQGAAVAPANLPVQYLAPLPLLRSLAWERRPRVAPGSSLRPRRP